MPTATEMKPILQDSIRKLEKWVEDHDYKGYEPFDGLSSYLRPLTFGNQLMEQILQQVIRQSPINLRPMLGVRPLPSTKGMGYMARGYLHMFERTGKPEYREKAFYCLDWLDQNRSLRYRDHSWGNHFDYASRSGRLEKDEPTIVWTSLIGQAFLDAYNIFKQPQHLSVIKSITKWVLNVPREETETGSCLSYWAFAQGSVHNSNMLGAAFLSRAAQFTDDSEALEVARKAMEYSCSRQMHDGAWYYGDADKYHWIDCFHTGYKLDSLKCYIENAGDRTFQDNLDRGYAYFKHHFIEPSGRPKYYHDRAYPIDIQCAAQAIDTLVYFSDQDKQAVEVACRVAQWTINNMQDKAGYFYYRILPLRKVRVPMIHWGQATMYKALSFLLRRA